MKIFILTVSLLFLYSNVFSADKKRISQFQKIKELEERIKFLEEENKFDRESLDVWERNIDFDFSSSSGMPVKRIEKIGDIFFIEIYKHSSSSETFTFYTKDFFIYHRHYPISKKEFMFSPETLKLFKEADKK